MAGHGVAAHPSAPVAAKLRLRYAKRGRGRFSSHRDVARAMEWALRRAGVPVALSQGFSPHPRLSWIGAAPTGAASEAEYLEIGVTEALDPALVAAALDAVLPDGLGVVDAVAVAVGAGGALADRIDASRWLLEFDGVDPGELARAVEALLARDVVEVERMTKNGMRTLDVRAAIVEIAVGTPSEPPPGVVVSPGGVTSGGRVDWRPTPPSPACGTLTVVVRHTTPAVRPDDVSSALRTVAGLAPPVPLKSTRTAQGRLDGTGTLSDPLDEDRTV